MSSKRTNNPQRRFLTNEEKARAILHSARNWKVYPSRTEKRLIELLVLLDTKEANDMINDFIADMRAEYGDNS